MDYLLGWWNGLPSGSTAHETKDADVDQLNLKPRPADWAGIPRGDRIHASSPFPCIGSACEAARKNHPVGSLCQPFKDVARLDSDKSQWQHMCAACSEDTTELERWHALVIERAQRLERERAQQRARQHADAAAAAHSGGSGSSSGGGGGTWLDVDELTAAEHAIVDAIIEDAAEQQQLEQQAGQQQQPEQPEQQQQQEQQAPPQRQRFLTHDDERAFAKSLWDAIAKRVPRAQHDGTLAMPDKGSSIDLKALHHELPQLPFVKPPPATARARDALRAENESGDKRPRHVARMENARQCFECEAAGVELAVSMPEVFARDQLMEDERYQVKNETGEVVGCKQCCPGCGCNKFVLIGNLNVNSATSVRYAYGNGRAIAPISSTYMCVNPDCPDVQDKDRKDAATRAVEMQLLRELTKDGILGASAKGRLGELKKLGVNFFGHDTRVILALPPRVRAMYQGLLYWPAGGCDDAFAEKVCITALPACCLHMQTSTTCPRALDWQWGNPIEYLYDGPLEPLCLMQLPTPECSRVLES